jgi:hypothetical protein
MVGAARPIAVTNGAQSAGLSEQAFTVGSKKNAVNRAETRGCIVKTPSI